jgi:hypothetical protein
MTTDFSTFDELFQHVEETFGGETVNPGRGKQITLSIPVEEFDEDAIYEFLPEWTGEWTDDENVVSYEGEVIVYTRLAVDTDGESLIPWEPSDLDEEEEDEEDEDDWTDDSAVGWDDDEF